MSAQSRRSLIEEMLRDDPNDPFLQYGLAVEYIKEGNFDEGIARLRELTENAPDYCAAYFQAGQALASHDRWDEARTMLDAGIAAAQRVGDLHAAGEMEEFLDQLPE